MGLALRTKLFSPRRSKKRGEEYSKLVQLLDIDEFKNIPRNSSIVKELLKDAGVVEEA